MCFNSSLFRAVDKKKAFDGFFTLKLLKIAHAGPSIFQQNWWLEAAGGSDIERVEVVWDGLSVATLPYMRNSRFGIRSLGMPPYTRTLGPILNLPNSGAGQRRKNLKRVMQEVVGLLPKHDRFFQLLDPLDQSVAFAFSLAGCDVGQHFTFRISPSEDLAQVWSNFHSSKRRLIRAAEKEFRIVDDLEISDFVRLIFDDVPRERNLHQIPILQRIYEACKERSQARILGVVNQEGRAVAAVALVWDACNLYYWTPVRSRRLTSAKENSFLLWNSIKFASNRKLNFDFDGYLSTASADFLSSFGAELAIRPAISHTGFLGKAAEFIKDAIHAPKE